MAGRPPKNSPDKVQEKKIDLPKGMFIHDKVRLNMDSDNFIAEISKDKPYKTNILLTQMQADELNDQQHNSKILFKQRDVEYELVDVVVGENKTNQKVLKHFKRKQD